MGGNLVIAVLDTHAVIWAMEDDPKLGNRARLLIKNAARNALGISDISLLEISMLVSKQRIQLSIPLSQYLNTVSQWMQILSIEPTVAVKAMELELPHSDPFDRVITATAVNEKLPLITKDRLIVDSGLVETVWN